MPKAGKHAVYKQNLLFCPWRVYCPVRQMRNSALSLGYHQHEDALNVAIKRLCCDGRGR